MTSAHAQTAVSVLVVVLAVGAGLAGCGSGEQTGPPGGVPRPPGPIEGESAGRLVVQPASVEAGETIGIAVENVGDVPILYGLDDRVQRRADGKWVNATADVYGTHRAVPGIGLIVRPGGRAGPDYGQVSDRIPLPRDLDPGTYRVVKAVSRDGRSRRTKLTATFRVRAPDGPRR